MTVVEINLLLEEHRTVLSTDFNLHFQSLLTKLGSVQSAARDHVQRISSLESSSTDSDQRLEQLTPECSAVQKDHVWLKSRVADLEGAVDTRTF